MKSETLFRLKMFISIAATALLLGCNNAETSVNQLVEAETHDRLPASEEPNPNRKWRVIEEKDSMTDQIRKSAVITNDDGYRLTIRRHQSRNEAWVVVAAAEGPPRFFSSGPLPMYRIDDHPAADLGEIVRRASPIPASYYFLTTPSWFAFHLASTDESKGRNFRLKQVMNGDRILIRYFTADGLAQETTFSLQGAAPHIAEALGIPVEPDAEIEAAAAGHLKSVQEALDACKHDNNCSLTQILRCSGDTRGDEQAFRRCMARRN